MPISASATNTTEAAQVHATCPLCATPYTYPADASTRGLALCPGCNATGRSAAIVHYVCRAIYDDDTPLLKQPKRKSARVIGLSDSEVYAKPFGKYFNYTNTWYHKRPKLDIRDPAPEYRNCADVVINSEVFEHVIGDTQSAFDGALKLLKPGGTMVFSVPFTYKQGSEHYPGLTDYTPRQREDGTWAADLVFDDGRRETDAAPKFHGGPGLTLELRLFSHQRIVDELTAAGFTDIQVHTENLPQFGIQWQNWSRMVTARAPGQLAPPPRGFLARLMGRA